MSQANVAVAENNQREAEQMNGFVVLNPASGEGNPEKRKEAIEAALGKGIFDLHETAENEDIRQVVQTAVHDNNYDWVAAVGGDGTVSQVADGLVGEDVPLLIIPSGTGNVLAKTLEIPQDTEQAAKLIHESHTVRHLDSVQIGQQHFFLQVGIGLESATMEETSSEQKNRWGLAAYLWTAVKQAFGWQPYHLTLTVDGNTHRLDATELVIANASKIGFGNLEWGDEIHPDDGRIDIAVAKAQSLGDYLRLIIDLVRGTSRKSPKTQFFTATDAIHLDAERPLPLHGDGENLDVDLPLDLKVCQGSLKVIVPA